MSGVIDDDGVQWEHCTACGGWVEIDLLEYEPMSAQQIETTHARWVAWVAEDPKHRGWVPLVPGCKYDLCPTCAKRSEVQREANAPLGAERSN